MAKVLVKKKKLKIVHFLIFLLIIGILVFSAYILLNTKIRNINITGNNDLSDEEILEQAHLTEYPSFFFTFSYQIKKRLEQLPTVESVTVEKRFFNVLNIKIKEYRIILKDSSTKEYILSSGEKISSEKEFRVPRLVSTLSDKKYQQLVTHMKDVNEEILGKISELEYVPNDYDKDRFLLYMNDDNMVYLTLTKFEMINYYNKVLPQLEGRKGILYLDSGNHFKIME